MLLALSVVAFAAEDKLATLKAGQPTPVIDLIDRIVDCDHWSGEEPYNAERREEIRKAITELRCDSLETDEEALLRKFKGDENVRKAIDAAKNLFF
jgi:hypothetical protein